MGVIFFGPESPGDILGPIAASVWGTYDSVRLPWQDGAKFRGRNSRRADVIDRHLRLHADGFVVVDKNCLRGSQPKAGQLLYNIATNADEGVGDGDSHQRRPFVFMGETTCSPAALLSAARLQLDPARLIAIPASAPRECWPFHDLHSFSSASRLGAHLSKILLPMSGAPISHYLTHLTKALPNDLPKLIKWLEDKIDHYELNYREFSVEAIDERLVAIFPIIYAAGILAANWNILPFSAEEIRDAVKFCENACFDHYTDVKGTRDPVKAVARFIADNRREYLMEIPAVEAFDFKQQLGFYTSDFDGFVKEIQIYPPRFRAQFAHIGWEKTLSACDEAGYLIRDNSSFESKCQLWPGESGRKYMYRFKSTIVNY